MSIEEPGTYVPYGEHITNEQLVQYLDEISNETIIPEEDLPDASSPLKESYKEVFYNEGMIDSGLPSNIPIKIDKLNKFHKSTETITHEEILAILLLKNTMDTDITISGSYNGVCVDLDTTNYNLTIDNGCAVAAL